MSQQILEAIAALADGIRARDKQWDAVSEQIRLLEQRLDGPSAANPVGFTLRETLNMILDNIQAGFKDMERFVAAATSGELEAKRKVWKEYTQAQLQQKTRRAKKRKR